MARITILGNNAEYYDVEKTGEWTGEWKPVQAPENIEEATTVRIQDIATMALSGKLPLPEEALEKVAKFYGIKPDDVSVSHVACFKNAAEAAKGDMAAFNLLISLANPQAKRKR